MAKNTMSTYERRQTTAGTKKAPTSGNTITGASRNTMSSGSKKAPTSSITKLPYKSGTPATPKQIPAHRGSTPTPTPLKSNGTGAKTPPSYTAASRNRSGNSGSTKMSTSRNTMKKYY